MDLIISFDNHTTLVELITNLKYSFLFLSFLDFSYNLVAIVWNEGF